MSTGPVPLPVLAGPPSRPLRLSPTDVSQFVRLEQCQRYLRFRLSERHGQTFMRDYDVTLQRITPLLSLSGQEFEEEVVQAVASRARFVHYADRATEEGDRPDNNAEVVREARRLTPGDAVVLFQPRLQVVLHGWLLRGDLDLLRLEKDEDGQLLALIIDVKSTTEVKVEHRLQVTFYQLMLEQILRDAGVECVRVITGILYRPPEASAGEDEERIRAHRDEAARRLGLTDALLEVQEDSTPFRRSVHDLVLGPDALARRVAGEDFSRIPFSLSLKCDGCLYTEYCMKSCAEHEDLSLLPHLSGVEKEALLRAGVGTIQALAGLKDLPGGGNANELVNVPANEPLVRRLSVTWPVGPRLDELIHRARSFRRNVRRDGTTALGYIPGKGRSSLPASTPRLNPNLVRVYIDAQHDYLNDRVYLLGALVVGCRDGAADPLRRRSVVHMTAGPPEDPAAERDLLVGWTQELVRAVVEVAAPGEKRGGKNTAPVHLVFFDRFEQRLLLEALARNFPPLVEASPPLYDFLTQLAAFDSPVMTYLDEEVRAFRNFPMTCQSLQSLATYLRFDWGRPHPFRETFKARMFDYLGKMDAGGGSEWYTQRSRFGSQVPLEYAYAAWKQRPAPPADGPDPFADFRPVTPDLLRAFQARRLEAVEHVAASLSPDDAAEKTPFVLPDLARFEDRARGLAQALHEFLTIERHVNLGEWRQVRFAPPERRVLMGEALLVSYREADQEATAAARNLEHQRRHARRKELERAARAASPHGQSRLTRDQRQECEWSPDGLRVRLRIETAGIDGDLHDLLSLCDIREGDRVVIAPRLAVDERLPEAERRPYTPTPKSLLYGMRGDIRRIAVTGQDESGRALAGVVEVDLCEAYGGEWSRGFLFPGIPFPLDEGRCYSLDPCPNDWYGYWCGQVVEGLCRGEPNRLYDLLASPANADRTPAATPGQARFLAGLFAFQAKGLLHDFERSKRTFIGSYGRASLLLVQGPPGTGKSYGTAYAIFARLQGALQSGNPFRVLLSCKTHAATDVLIENVREVRDKLAELRQADPTLFARYFDGRLLDVPLCRLAPRDPPPQGIRPLAKDAGKADGEPRNADLIGQERWAVVAATPGGAYGLVKGKWNKNLFGHGLFGCLVLDEASQMNLPEAVMAALPLAHDGQIIVVGDHRQMPPIVHHDWDREARRTFQEYQVYTSLFDTLRRHNPPMIQFAESFRLHSAMADFLREEVYRHDGIHYFSRRRDLLPSRPAADPMVGAVLTPEYPLVVLLHDEASSQVRNPFEQSLIEPLIRFLASADGHALDAEDGLGVVVPHRAQRAALRQTFPELCVIDAVSGLAARSAIDTVERFQGGERTVILVSATESDPAYLLASSEFLLDPRRLTVALSRAKRKMVLVASRSIFSLFSPDEEVFANSQLWKNLLLRTCTVKLWEGERDGRRVQVWGGPAKE